MSISIETTMGIRNAHRELPLTADAAREAVRALNGDDTTALGLDRDGYALAIGGGPDRFSVGYMTPDPDGRAYTLVLDREATGMETHVIGGNWTDLPALELVCREAAEKAAVEFAETGQIKLTPDWLDNEELSRLEQANADGEIGGNPKV